MPTEELRIAITIERNGEDVAGIGLNCTEFFENGENRLEADYVSKTLILLVAGTVRKLRKMQLAHPFEDPTDGRGRVWQDGEVIENKKRMV